MVDNIVIDTRSALIFVGFASIMLVMAYLLMSHVFFIILVSNSNVDHLYPIKLTYL